MGVSISGGIRMPVYSCADAVALAALTNMLTGDLCLQIDTNTWYFYNGATWAKVATVTATDGAGLKLISRKSLSAAASADWTGISGYDSLLLIFDVTGSEATNKDLMLRFNGDTGNTYGYQSISNNALSSATNQPKILLASTLTNAIAYGGFFHIPVNKRSSNNQHLISGTIAGIPATDQKCIYGTWTYDAAITQVTLLPSANTISGTASLYGFVTA